MQRAPRRLRRPPRSCQTPRRMAWRGTAIAAATAALLLAAPQGAAAQSCQVPKAWETAALQLQYDLGLELGLTEAHTRELLRAPTTTGAVTYAGQRFVSAGYLTAALARYGTTVLGAPPECAAARRR